VNPSKLDASRSFITFDLESGKITPRDVLQKELTPLPTIEAEPIGVGDTLSLEIIGNKSIVVTDYQVNSAFISGII